MSSLPAGVVLRARPYDHPDVQFLIEGLQSLYVEVYGGRDESEIDASEFEPPRGVVAVVSDGDRPVAMGAWRMLDGGRAELKRLFVRPEHRGRGLSRQVLTWLERSARDGGAAEMVIETSTHHPEAVQLYLTAGYSAIENYGHYAHEPRTRSFSRRL